MSSLIISNQIRPGLQLPCGGTHGQHSVMGHQLLMSWGSGVRRRSVEEVAGSDERDTDVRRRSEPSPKRGAECRDTDCRVSGSACCRCCP